VVDVGQVNAARLSFARSVTLAELDEKVQAFVSGLGFRYTNLVDFARWRLGPDDKPWLLCTFPMDWVRHYYASNYGGVDPVPRALVAYPDIVIRSRMPPPADPAQAAIMDEIRRGEIAYGIEDFIAIPILRLDVPVGAFFATGPTAVCEGAAGLALAHLAPMLYRHAFDLHEADAGRGRQKARGNLSRREADCLKWAAAGKTTWEIGAILSISEHTVAVHLRHVNRKLNVSSRAQAVAEAMKRNLL
jgi:DNA-binding CsgD family transcriptional regulator